MDDSISQKVAFLIEMFEDLPTDFIEDLVSQNSTYSLEQLVNECLNKNEGKQMKQSTEMNKETEFAEMISLIPASTTSYFNVHETEHKVADHEENDTAIDIKNALPPSYRTFLETHSKHKDVVKIIDIYSHLFVMREQYKLKYERRNPSAQQVHNLHACILMIDKLMRKIHEAPTVAKYRSIRESNEAFQRKIAHIEGAKLLLIMCGWDYIESDSNHNDAIYVFNAALSISWIQMVSHFLYLYIEHEIKHAADAKMEQDPPIITKFPRKKLKPKNQKLGKQTRKLPKMKRLSAQQLREKRLRNLGNIEDEHYGTVVNTNENIIGPIADGIIDLNAPNLRNELLEIGKKKHRKWINSRQARKRVFTLKDIEQLRKEEFDRKAKGATASNEMDSIGKEALKLTNDFRKQHGLSPLKWHQSLCDIGKVHSEDMSRGKVPFGHQGFNDRVKQYPFRTLAAAENVAMSQGLSDVARVAVDGWIQSPGHRKNLLSNHNYCGIGVYRGYNNAYYLTQLFALT